jgi:hypothetical protein
MTAADQPRQAPGHTPAQRRRPARVSGALRRVLLRTVPPYARYSARQAATAAALERMEGDFEHIRKRHTEQIERLEELARELVLTTESLRRELARRDGGEA